MGRRGKGKFSETDLKGANKGWSPSVNGVSENSPSVNGVSKIRAAFVSNSKNRAVYVSRIMIFGGEIKNFYSSKYMLN